jgi:hypothetical protein
MLTKIMYNLSNVGQHAIFIRCTCKHLKKYSYTVRVKCKGINGIFTSTLQNKLQFLWVPVPVIFCISKDPQNTVPASLAA